MRNIDHERARAAFNAVADRFRNWNEAQDKTARSFRSVTLSATTELRQVGLLQLFAFWGSKKGSERMVLEDVVGWLALSDVTRTICAGSDRPAVSGPVAAVMAALMQRTSAEIAVLEEEARRYLVWHKRFTEGHWRERETQQIEAD